MIASLLAWIAASPWMWTALRYGAILLAVLLFLLVLWRSGERARRLADLLETAETINASGVSDFLRALLALRR